MLIFCAWYIVKKILPEIENELFQKEIVWFLIRNMIFAHAFFIFFYVWLVDDKTAEQQWNVLRIFNVITTINWNCVCVCVWVSVTRCQLNFLNFFIAPISSTLYSNPFIYWTTWHITDTIDYTNWWRGQRRSFCCICVYILNDMVHL